MVERYFRQYAIVDQDILGSKESVDKVLALLPDDILSFPEVSSPYKYFTSPNQYQSDFTILSVTFGTISKKISEILQLFMKFTQYLISESDLFIRGVQWTVISLSLTAHIKKDLTIYYQEEKNPMKRWERLCTLVEHKKVNANYLHSRPRNNLKSLRQVRGRLVQFPIVFICLCVCEVEC